MRLTDTFAIHIIINMFMNFRYGFSLNAAILTIAYVFGILGCEQSKAPKIADDKYTPFKIPKKVANEKYFIHCSSLVYQLNDHIDIDETISWSDADIAHPYKIAPQTKNLWLQNGLSLHQFTKAQFNKINTEIIAAGGEYVEEKAALLKKPSAFTSVYGSWREDPFSLFFTDRTGKLTGMTLTQGDTLFRMTFALLQPPPTPIFNMTIIPLHRKFSRYNQDDINLITPVAPLGFVYPMAKDHYLAICLSKSQVSGNLGRYFLWNDDNGQGQQIVIILAPNTFTLKRVIPKT